jgi:ribose transport system ATP-binding protein
MTPEAPLDRGGLPQGNDGPPARLRVEGLSKSFSGTQALRDFHFELRAGEVHALVGGNGSGKSTFIKILAGVYAADEGELVTPDGRWDLTSQGPSDAETAGLRFVHQDLGIFPMLSLTDNLAIGRGFITGPTGRIKWRATKSEASRILTRYKVGAGPNTLASDISIPQRAMLAIARAMQDLDEENSGVLILDEPTASLPPEEANLLIDSIRRLATEGHAIVIVTHRLDEVRRVADRVTAVRDGNYVGTVPAEDMTEGDLTEMILGRRLAQQEDLHSVSPGGEPVIRVKGLRGGPIQGVDFSVFPGEVVGVAGLLDSGRTELLELIFGARRLDAGEIEFGGRTIRKPNPRMMRRLGMAFVPEDRGASAIFPEQTVSENMTAGGLGRYFSRGWLNDRQIRRSVDSDSARFHVKASSPGALIDTLSGGNQQKVVMARWLRDEPGLLLLDEPDQGIDVGARQEIFALLSKATAAGAAVILVSSEFEELTRLCNRILVLSGGQIAAELNHGLDGHDLLESVLTNVR